MNDLSDIFDRHKKSVVDFIDGVRMAAYQQGRADAYRQREEADGCEGCAFMSNEEWEEPCKKCKRACKDYWRPKEQKNEHIGKRNAIQ